MKQPFKVISLCTILLLCTVNVICAQSWKGPVEHNGYSCFAFKTSGDIAAYAAKGMGSNMQFLFIKIKVPYNWGNTGTGHVRFFKKDLITGAAESQVSFFDYRNGWLYFAEPLFDWCKTNRRGNNPCNNFVITLYEENDHGGGSGRKIVVDLNLGQLNTSQMRMNEMAFETHW